MRLRAGKAGTGEGAGRTVAQAIAARQAGATGTIVVRGDSAYSTRAIISACLRAKVCFSLVMAKITAAQRAFDSLPDDAWTAVKCPGGMRDPDTGACISEAGVAETTYTAIASTKTPVTARLIVRCVKTPASPTRCFRCGGIIRSSAERIRSWIRGLIP